MNNISEGIGTVICSYEYDRIRERLEDIDAEPKGEVMDYLVDNGYMEFDIE